MSAQLRLPASPAMAQTQWRCGGMRKGVRVSPESGNTSAAKMALAVAMRAISESVLSGVAAAGYVRKSAKAARGKHRRSIGISRSHLYELAGNNLAGEENKAA